MSDDATQLLNQALAAGGNNEAKNQGLLDKGKEEEVSVTITPTMMPTTAANTGTTTQVVRTEPNEAQGKAMTDVERSDEKFLNNMALLFQEMYGVIISDQVPTGGTFELDVRALNKVEKVLMYHKDKLHIMCTQWKKTDISNGLAGFDSINLKNYGMGKKAIKNYDNLPIVKAKTEINRILRIVLEDLEMAYTKYGIPKRAVTWTHYSGLSVFKALSSIYLDTGVYVQPGTASVWYSSFIPCTTESFTLAFKVYMNRISASVRLLQYIIPISDAKRGGEVTTAKNFVIQGNHYVIKEAEIAERGLRQEQGPRVAPSTSGLLDAFVKANQSVTDKTFHQFLNAALPLDIRQWMQAAKRPGFPTFISDQIVRVMSIIATIETDADDVNAMIQGNIDMSTEGDFTQAYYKGLTTLKTTIRQAAYDCSVRTSYNDKKTHVIGDYFGKSSGSKIPTFSAQLKKKSKKKQEESQEEEGEEEMNKSAL